MVVHLGILPVVLPQLEYAQLVDSHVTYLPTLTTEEGLLGFLPWKPPVLTQVHVRQLLVEVEVAAPVLGERNVRSWGLFDNFKSFRETHNVSHLCNNFVQNKGGSQHFFV